MAPREEQSRRLVHDFQDYGSFDEVNDTKFWNESGKTRKKKRKHGLFKLFQYANNADIFLMIVGALCAVIQGSCYPILSIVFGQMTNSFIQLATQKDHAAPNRDNLTKAAPNLLENSLHENISSPEEFNLSIIQYSHLYLLIAGVVFFNAFLQTFCWEWVAERQVHRLRRVFFSQVLRQDIQWFDQNESGNLPNKLSDDLERVRSGIGCKFSLVIQYLSTFVSGLVIGFIVNWRLTSIIILVGPFLIAISSFIAKSSANWAAREQKKYAIAGSIAEEVIVNIKTVAAFCKESFEMKRYKKALNEGRKIAMKNYRALACGIGSILFLMYLSYGFAFYFGASLVVNGLCTPGSIFTVFLSVMTGAFSVGNALPFVNCVSAAIGAASSIFDITDRVPEIDPYSNKGLKPCSVDGCIELRNLSFKYPARPKVEVLHDVSIKIEPGNIVAFVGASGAGKSTIVGLILRFYNPSAGTITLDGIPLHHLNVHWLRNQIGIVSQEPVLFSGTIADNIRYGKDDVTQEEIEKAARIANAHYFISKLPEGYNTHVGERGCQLSGGQNQRIAISRALVRNPKILLLDEATSALDSLNESVVQEALGKAMQGRTTIIIAHRLSTVRDADRIYVIKDGYVAESGKHEELLSRKSLYYNLVLAQTLNKPIDEVHFRKRNNSSLSEYRFYGSPRSSLASSYEEFEELPLAFREENLADISVWQLVKFNSREWLSLTVGILMCAVAGMTMPLFSIFYSQIFIIFTLPSQEIMIQAEFWSKMFMLLAVISGIAIFTQIICMTHASEKLVMRMRSKAFNNILKQPVCWFDLESSSSGYLITRLARDAPLIKSAAGLRVGHVITALVTLVSGFGIAFYFGWKLTLVLCFGVPFIAGATYQQNIILKKNQIRDTKLMEIAGRIANECIQNIRTVQALGNEELFVKQYMESLELPLKEAKTYALSFGAIFSLSQTTISVMYAVAFRYGAYLIQMGEMSPEQIYCVFFALSFCAASVGNTLSFMQDYSKAKLAARRMMQLINQKSEIDPTELYGSRPEMQGNILFKNVHFTYPSRIEVNVLKGLSFSLSAGKTLALVGESGSGKSTVISLLERFYNVAAGLIRIEDQEIGTINVRHLRRSIGLVTQIPVLFDCSIKENIAYGIIPRDENDELVMHRVIAAAKSVNIHNFITSLPMGYDTLVGEKGTQLSGGQKQRIAIARALIKNPKILLLDEATSALDPECEKIVQDTLDRARKGRTCIIIAHRLSTVQNADIIAVVHRGKIIETGTHAELLSKRGYYYKLTERQQI